MVGLSGTRSPKAHALAVGFGQPQYVFESQDSDDPDAPELAWEASLKYKVSKNITMIPAIFYLPESSSTQGESGLRAVWCRSPDRLQVLITWPNFGWAFRTTFLTHTHIPSPPLRRAFFMVVLRASCSHEHCS